MQTKDLFIDSHEQPIKVRIFNPIRLDVETLSFTLGWVIEDHILSKSTGWRLKAGKIIPPSRSTTKGYIPTSTLSGRLNKALDRMIQPWRKHFRGVEFPEMPDETSGTTKASDEVEEEE